jgi:glycosyltransferase involved in cell wall biosynthesis
MVDVFIAPSEFIRGALQRWGIRSGKTRVVRNFVPLTRNVSRPLGAFGVYIGRLSAEKGVETLLRSLVAAGDPPFRIVGDGPLRDSLSQTATDLGLQRTIFTGFLSSREVESMLEGARFLAMHSLSDENAPVAVTEAMAAGRPVVVTSNGGLPELVRHGGGLVSEPGDAEKFGEHIRLLMNDDDECSRLGAEARRIVEEDFMPERHLALLEAAYDLAIARRMEISPVSKS